MERKGEEKGLTRHVGVQAGQTTKHVYFHIIPRPRPDMLSLYSTARDVSTVMDHDQRVAAVVEGMRTGMPDDEGLEPSIMIAGLKLISLSVVMRIRNAHRHPL